jgi:predicted dehydrogenase
MIGAGSLAVLYLEAWNRVEGGEVVAIASRTRRNAESLARRFGIAQVCSSIEGLIRDASVDVISIALPHNLHHSLAMAAIDAGKSAVGVSIGREPSFPPTWRFRRNAAGASALADLGVYDIDAARWLIGEFSGVVGHLGASSAANWIWLGSRMQVPTRLQPICNVHQKDAQHGPTVAEGILEVQW